MTFAPMSGKRSLLVIAHPGHELRLLGWMRETRPLVAILTDGSGSTGRSRTDLSLRLIKENGGEVAVAGHFTEPDLYALLMRGESAPLVAFAHELARLIDTNEVGQVVCDAVEGYHPGHDLCLPLTQAAARLRATGTTMPHHCEYRVVGDPRPTGIDEEVVFELDNAALRDKIERSRRYAAQSGAALEQEFQGLFDTFGEDAFRFEVLRPADGRDLQLQAGVRYYELRGEQQVRAGRYREVLRYAQHMLPVEAALRAC